MSEYSLFTHLFKGYLLSTCYGLHTSHYYDTIKSVMQNIIPELIIGPQKNIKIQRKNKVGTGNKFKNEVS